MELSMYIILKDVKMDRADCTLKSILAMSSVRCFNAYIGVIFVSYLFMTNTSAPVSNFGFANVLLWDSTHKVYKVYIYCTYIHISVMSGICTWYEWISFFLYRKAEKPLESWKSSCLSKYILCMKSVPILLCRLVHDQANMYMITKSSKKILMCTKHRWNFYSIYVDTWSACPLLINICLD